ncbi:MULTISPECIES: SDR family oxidoreductase [Pontibacillus]|uniref:SDR family oxidoreductase n=1 Tax=Pontibacillus chungwhensis TaxID=265426 RepID=A0ABY8V2L5_9BACI|nr:MULTISPECIES: SDR family oxidoreductase [Pontibacillus]MCD5324466.1 SDR family oxidoreductase [Pontibacillus sp. HN14]WIF99241.1 SDR family oxidoreductase [Pontibacillus chungwhensis]
MKRVLVAGATGYLGRYVVKAFKEAGYSVKVLVRSKEKMKEEGPFSSPAIMEAVDEFVVGDVAEPASLKGICSDVDYVFSSVGLTRQKGKLTFKDVDYKGNLNLLKEAEESKVERFMYINVHGAEDCPSALIQAKKKFVQELEKSDLDSTIVNPTGYFSDMTEFASMAKKGRVLLFGKGDNKMNPIHGQDLAYYCVRSISEKHSPLNVGGPDVYTYREMAELASQTVNPEAKITSIPVWTVKAMLPFLRITNKKQYDLFQFFFYVMTHDVVAEPYGKIDLKTYFEEGEASR